MNERIQELVKQADIEFDVSSDNYGVDTATVTPYDLEKFARLLIQTCADYAEYQLQIGGTNADKIKQHFGVSE